MADYKYVIKLDNKVVFEGVNPKPDLIPQLAKKYPKKRISIAWVDLTGDVLIAKIQI